MLDKHEIGLFPCLRQPRLEAIFELHLLLRVVLREWRIGEDTVEASKFTPLIEMLGISDGVALSDVSLT